MFDLERFVAVVKGEREISMENGKPTGLTFYPCTFEPSLSDEDGVILEFAPLSYSKVQRINEGWQFTDLILGGDGWLLIHRINREVAVRKVSSEDVSKPITYGNGDIAAYIAGRSGLKVFGMNCPVFDPEKTETDISEQDSIGQSLNPKFWEVYHFLNKLNS